LSGLFCSPARYWCDSCRIVMGIQFSEVLTGINGRDHLVECHGAPQSIFPCSAIQTN
jgi:hypothetical protein